ncbi:hypothetical protein C8R48DRAFT_778410 [Suillus tomentosus]|nr:hypothetical protein C8R48DRAFT_778410 [Suillus tomentosus]
MSVLNIVPFDRSTPGWPTQLRRYAPKARQEPPLVPNFLVQAMQFDDFRQNVHREWEEHIHPSGAIYYYNRMWKTYTGLNVKDCPKVRLENFETWVKSTRGRVKGDTTIVAEPARTQNVAGDVYLYYLVVPDAHIIGWLEPLDGTHLFRECDFAREWNHKSALHFRIMIYRLICHSGLELEAQFWKHVEFFPHNFKLDRSLVRQLRAELDWFHAENSTSATIFSNRETTEKIITRLASLGSDGNVTEPGVALFGRLYHMLRHHQYLNYHGQPEARLLRSHSTGVRRQKREPFHFIATVAMLCLPMLVRDRLNQIYVDGLVNSLDIKNFVDDFSAQITAQITLAGVIMAIDAGFLAVQGVGTGMVAESILKGSIIFCVGCMFSGMFVQYFGEKLKTLRFAAYYLDQGMTVVIGVFSAPSERGIMNLKGQTPLTAPSNNFKGGTRSKFSKDKFNMEVTEAELVLIEHALGCMNEHQGTLPLLNTVWHLLSSASFSTPHGPPSIGESIGNSKIRSDSSSEDSSSEEGIRTSSTHYIVSTEMGHDADKEMDYVHDSDNASDIDHANSASNGRQRRVMSRKHRRPPYAVLKDPIH